VAQGYKRDWQTLDETGVSQQRSHSNSPVIASDCGQLSGDRRKGGTIAPVSQHSRQLSAGLRKVKMVNATNQVIDSRCQQRSEFSLKASAFNIPKLNGWLSSLSILLASATFASPHRTSGRTFYPDLAISPLSALCCSL